MILSTSPSSDDNLLKDTTKLPRTTLDLATNGESFSQFSRGKQGRTLDVGTLAINAGDNGNTSSPLLRLFVSGTRDGEADNLKVKKFVGKKNGEARNGGRNGSNTKIEYKTLKADGSDLEKKEVTNFGKSLDAQVFLPTSLIGTDFTGKNVVILSVENGGEDLEVTSKKAQTGFTTYWVEITKAKGDKNSQGNGTTNGVNGVKGVSATQTTASQSQATPLSTSASTAPTTTTTALSSTPTSTTALSSTTPTSPSTPKDSSQSSSTSHQWLLGKTMQTSINKDSLGLANTILTNNYTHWNKTLNSLNKRMGELRDETHSQGIWARVFGGEQTSTYGYAQIDSGYVTLQAGYDYAFFFTPPYWGEATLFLGAAISYGLMTSKSQEFMGSDLISAPYAYDALSHSLELGVYAIYLHSCGFYLDSIFKFGYITSDFKGVNAHSSQTNVSNYHTTLGGEAGYRIKFGKDKEWSITPQIELIYGYLSESEAKQEYDGQILHSILEGVSTFRTRVGSDFSYRFKHKDKIYDFILGVSYEVDYANANASYGVWGADYLDRVSENSLINTDHRMVLDVGMNITLCENFRLYANLESSFFGKVNTKYEVNFGVRYSFGEKRGAQIRSQERMVPRVER